MYLTLKFNEQQRDAPKVSKGRTESPLVGLQAETL